MAPTTLLVWDSRPLGLLLTCLGRDYSTCVFSASYGKLTSWRAGVAAYNLEQLHIKGSEIGILNVV